jgi:hypothetical protein
MATVTKNLTCEKTGERLLEISHAPILNPKVSAQATYAF